MTNARTIIGLFIIIIGLGALFNVPVFRFIIPVFIIYIGYKIMTGWSRDPLVRSSTTKEDTYKRVVVFSGLDDKLESDNFTKAEIVTVFGGGQLDLRKSKTKEKETKIELVVIFGGLKVIVPETWKVKTEGVGILGAFENKANTSSKTTSTVSVSGVSIFGGVEITS